MTHPELDQLFKACWVGESPWEVLADWLQEWLPKLLKPGEDIAASYFDRDGLPDPYKVEVFIYSPRMVSGDYWFYFKLDARVLLSPTLHPDQFGDLLPAACRDHEESVGRVLGAGA